MSNHRDNILSYQLLIIRATLVSILHSCYKVHIFSRSFLSLKATSKPNCQSDFWTQIGVYWLFFSHFVHVIQLGVGKSLEFPEILALNRRWQHKVCFSDSGSSKIPFHVFSAFLSRTKSLALAPTRISTLCWIAASSLVTVNYLSYHWARLEYWF